MCLCDGVPCRRCGERNVRRPLTNYYDWRDGGWCHVPWFGYMKSCPQCQRSASTPATGGDGEQRAGLTAAERDLVDAGAELIRTPTTAEQARRINHAEDDDQVYDYEESRRFFAEQGVTLLPPDGERYPPGSTTIIAVGVERRPEPHRGDRVQVCVETGRPDGCWQDDCTIVRAPHTEDGERLVWIAPTDELNAADERRRAGVNPPGYPQASSVSLGAVRLLTEERERAARSANPIEENR